ncbi:UNVERIFIED_CONTAM: hypothetical protein FKN15_034204 [Acipenser sinensis]
MERRDGLTIFGQRNTPKKRRKSRTAFTNHQIYELEKRFLYQKYLSPADRDQIAQQLGLTNAQVITWFQNRRAKLKRDLEEMKADVESAKSGRDGLTIFGQRNTPKKRRKSRTAFTNHQIYELEKRFLYQKYLSPADRDQIAQQLGLTNAQVITWFQNRRAKLKRDLEEMKADVESAKSGAPDGKTITLDIEPNPGAIGTSRSQSPLLSNHGRETSSKLQMSPSSPFTDHATSQECSEDEEDVEIDVDD